MSLLLLQGVLFLDSKAYPFLFPGHRSQVTCYLSSIMVSGRLACSTTEAINLRQCGLVFLLFFRTGGMENLSFFFYLKQVPTLTNDALAVVLS